MPRKKEGDRAWVRYREREGRAYWELVLVEQGRRTAASFAVEAGDRGEAERAARRELRIIEARLAGGRLSAPLTFGDAVEAYRAHRLDEGDREASTVTAGYRLRAVGETVGMDSDPLLLTREQAIEHRRRREKEGRSPVTIREEIKHIVLMQRWFTARGWIPAPTWADAPKPKGEGAGKEVLLPHEVGPWLRAAERLGRDPGPHRATKDWQRWPAAAWLMVHGLRRGELRRLRVRDLDLQVGAVYIRDRQGARTKTQASVRAVPIESQRALDVLRETFRPLYAAGDLDDVCFPSETGGMLAEATRWFLVRAEATSEEAGVRRVVPHGVRHSTVTLGTVAGVALSGMSRIVGHASTETTERYQHATAELLRPAMRGYGAFLDRAVEGQPAAAVVTTGRPRIGVDTVSAEAADAVSSRGDRI